MEQKSRRPTINALWKLRTFYDYGPYRLGMSAYRDRDCGRITVVRKEASHLLRLIYFRSILRCLDVFILRNELRWVEDVIDFRRLVFVLNIKKK